MVTIVQGWRVSPRSYRDAELVRFITSDPDATPLERDLALRLDKLLYQVDEAERNPKQMELF